MHPSDILQASPIPQFVIDRDHHVLYWNKALEKYSGIPTEEVIGTNLQWRAFYLRERPCMADLLVDQALEKIPEWYKGKYQKSGLVDDAYEAIDFFPHMGEEGTWLHFTAAPIRDETGEIIGAVETLEDITDQKKAEAVLLQNEERYRSLFEGAAEGILVTDLETHKIIHANPAICLMLGYSEHELTGIDVDDIHPKEYHNQIKEKLMALATGEETHATNIPCLRKDGTILNTDISTSTIIINKKVCNVGFFIDVTKRRVVEEIFQENEEGYSALFYKNHSVSLLIDPETGMIIDANTAACEYYGYPLEELTRKGIYDINHLPREMVIPDLIRAKAKKEKHFFSTHYLASGEKRYVEVYSGPITVQGKALFYSIIHDITDRKLAELALSESESRLQSIIQGTPIPKFVIDNNHQVIYWNKALEKYCGIAAEEVIRTNQQWRAFYLQERPCMADLLLDGAIEKIPQWYEGKFSRSKLVDGAYEATDYFPRMGKEGTWLYFTAAPIRDETGRIIGAVETLEDITERKLAEKALRESEALLNDIVRGSPIPQFVVDQNHHVIYWNEALEICSGVPADEVVGTNQQWRAFYLNERPCMADLLVDGSIEKIPQWYEGKYSISKLVDGAYEATDFFPRMGIEGKWLYFTAAPIRDETGRIIGAVETLEDITERKLAEKALRESEALLNDIVRGSPIPQFVVDQSHHVIYWNEALEICSGVPADEVVGTNQQWRAFYLNERPCMADLLVDGSIEKIPQWYEGKYSTSKLVDGAYEAIDFFPRMGIEGKWLYFTAAPIRDETGRIIGAVETLEDITERKLAEKALKESEALLNDIVRGSPIPQFVVDQNHHVIYWNEALEKYSRINHTEVIGTNWQWRAFYLKERPCMADLLVDGAIEKIPQWYEGKYNKSKLLEGAYEATDFFPKMGNEGTWLYFTAAPIRDETGKIIGAVETLEDITPQKKATEKLAKKAEELARSNTELEQFAYIASHDLQEPLRMIGSYLQLIERRYKGRLDSDADEFIAYAVDGAQRLKNMINGLLEFSRVQTRGVPFQPVSAEKILADSLLNMKMSIDETGAVITHDPLPTIMGDPDQFIRVLQNLINNAIKFRGEKSPQIHISARQEGDFWIFSVKDNGMGFEEKYRDQLFILFRRLLGSAYPGTGIGLAVCKRIIERHDGKIWAESQPGTGSTFFFTIPVRGETIV